MEKIRKPLRLRSGKTGVTAEHRRREGGGLDSECRKDGELYRDRTSPDRTEIIAKRQMYHLLESSSRKPLVFSEILSFGRKMEDPTTRKFAPASRMEGRFSIVTPPSIPI